ncbi:MAG: hypothetical protein R3A46_07795 [Thermomicrobiales bacterium]
MAFTITFDGQTTAKFLPMQRQPESESALEALSDVEPADVSVTGTDFALGFNPGNTLSIEFMGQYAAWDVPEITVSSTGLW